MCAKAAGKNKGANRLQGGGGFQAEAVVLNRVAKDSLVKKVTCKAPGKDEGGSHVHIAGRMNPQMEGQVQIPGGQEGTGV